MQAVKDVGVRVRRIEEAQSEMLEILKELKEQRYLYYPPSAPTPCSLPSVFPRPLSSVPRRPLPSVSPQSLPPVSPRPLPSFSPQLLPSVCRPPLPSTIPPRPLPPLPPRPFQVMESPAELSLYHETSPTPPNYQPEPLGLNHTYFNLPLTSDQIPKRSLMSVEDSLKGCRELMSAEKASTLTQKLAKEAIFGVEIMKRCTPGGTKEFPALPKEEMFILKKIVYKQLPQFWHSPMQFEKLWKNKCWPAVEQACRRIRHRGQ